MPAQTPDSLIAEVDGLGKGDARRIAQQAVRIARQTMPKLSGASGKRITPVWGEGYWGLEWKDAFLWYQERGFKPFTMKNLHGVIPMWIDDPTGSVRQENPKAKTRYFAETGRTQVLIFRFASAPGQRKMVRKGGKVRSVPRSYPGAPGRIGRLTRHTRETAQPPATKPGQIAKTNVGVRWRHPGLPRKDFLLAAVVNAGADYLLTPRRVVAYYPTGKHLTISKPTWQRLLSRGL